MRGDFCNRGVASAMVVRTTYSRSAWHIGRQKLLIVTIRVPGTMTLLRVHFSALASATARRPPDICRSFSALSRVPPLVARRHDERAPGTLG